MVGLKEFYGPKHPLLVKQSNIRETKKRKKKGLLLCMILCQGVSDDTITQFILYSAILSISIKMLFYKLTWYIYTIKITRRCWHFVTLEKIIPPWSLSRQCCIHKIAFIYISFIQDVSWLEQDVDLFNIFVVLCVDQGFVIFYFVHMLLCLFALLNPCTVNIVLKSIGGVSNYNFKTNDMCLHPDTYLTWYSIRTPNQSGDFHWLVRYICSAVSLPITLVVTI